MTFFDSYVNNADNDTGIAITSRKNPLVQKLREILSDKKARDEEGVTLIEGAKLCEEAVLAGLTIKLAVFTPNACEKYHALFTKAGGMCKIVLVNPEVAEAISDVKTPQGVFFLTDSLDKSKKSDTIYSNAAGKLVILLDGVQDPGNVGSIMRSAECFGASGFIASANSADINSPKVLRAAMGSAFRLPVLQQDMTKALPLLNEAGFTTVASLLDKSAMTLEELRAYSAEHHSKIALVIGSEGAGISPEAAALCQKKVYIPISGANSLNAAAAAAVLLYQLTIHN